ncbi:helix-turn-helix transcriptional regulator [Cohnella silvisoli]|uniref:Transcriptional regulator n=1 Tax=Cohnella silvisoli TaxID=2873699 RepID=A0ABV1KU58_9BACL|nr:metalloregulator ArsR/SmtB family transcription factor [Cohnella silvisoli]MCD9023187.1 transcriptional regulator [Cohnella silvisoli]
MLPQQEISTRRQLLQLLKTQGNCCISDLSKELGITEMAVRRHIHSLERDNLIRSVLVRQAMGRPLYRYSLTEQADDLFPKNYPQLTLDLLSELEEQTGGSEVIDRMFQGRKDKLESRYRERMLDRPLADKVSELSSIQNSGGYMTEWMEAEEDGTFVLYEYNCPIAQVANRYRQACHCEQQLFEQLLGASVERTECLADGGARCTYAIRPVKANLINN